MKIYSTAIILFSLLVSSTAVFSAPIFSPHVCSGYNQKGGSCVASCKAGEISVCRDASDANDPQCYCKAGNSDRSFNGFLDSLKIEAIKDNNHSLAVVADIILQADRDLFPEGERLVAATALCDARPPEPLYCSIRLPDVLPLP